MLKYLLVFCALLGSGCAAPVDEIEGLLAYVGKLEGATFVRNGEAHTPAEAAAHLRRKWVAQKTEIQTAEDFIVLCATKSSLSGKAYTIRFADGREEPAADVLQAQLQRMRSAAAGHSAKTPDQPPGPPGGRGA